MSACCLTPVTQMQAQSDSSPSPKMEVGNYCSSAPYGITLLVDRGAAFVVTPEVDMGKSWSSERDEALLPYPVCAADGSYYSATGTYQGKEFTFTWGPINDHIVGAVLTSKEAMALPLHWRQPFSGCKNIYWAKDGELRGHGYATNTRTTTPIRVICQSGFAGLEANYQPETTTWCNLDPSQPTILILAIGDGPVPSFDEVEPALKAAGEAYANTQVKAEGDWGNYLGAIAKSLNGSRLFSSLDRRIVHCIGRGWWIAHQHPIDEDDDQYPYFAWDNFFNANMASLEDPVTARETVRATLDYQTPEGMVPNYAHWPCGNQFVTVHRTNPPVGSLCVWKLHERWPDMDFLKEVYPKLVKWHDWFRFNRSRSPEEYLFSWGNGRGNYHEAVLESGWDDTPAFDGGQMENGLINQYHVDLTSLWAMDAEYLAKMADALGLPDDAARFRTERDRVVEAMNEKMWNEDLGIYCHRSWYDNADGTPNFLTRVTPLNFYALICGAPDKKRTKQVLKYLHNPEKFWGEYLMPTLPYDDPEHSRQSYWRGHTWGPETYLVWLGVQRCDDAKHVAEYARRTVNLFMRNWNTPLEACAENYNSDTGGVGDDPHYTWGALLPLIGLEALVDVDADLNPVARNNGISEDITLRRVPVGGKLYTIENKDGKVTCTKE